MLNILNDHLPIFNDYFVENFHSSLRYQTAESNTDKQIIQKAKIIDIERIMKGLKILLLIQEIQIFQKLS